MAPKIFGASKIKLSGLDDTCLTRSGFEIASPGKALSLLGFADVLSALKALQPKIVNDGVQNAAVGMILDPAGSAVGVSVKPTNSGAAGASGAIYAKFSDLEPIPSMTVGEAVFNSSSGPGHRIVHSFSPRLSGSPSNVGDCQNALEMMANAYANALSASNNPPASVTSSGDASLFNLTPLSGKIFASNFLDGTINHLHPSYTLTALAIAQASLVRNKERVLPTTLCYFEKAVSVSGDAVLARMYSGQALN